MRPTTGAQKRRWRPQRPRTPGPRVVGIARDVVRPTAHRSFDELPDRVRKGVVLLVGGLAVIPILAISALIVVLGIALSLLGIVVALGMKLVGWELGSHSPDDGDYREGGGAEEPEDESPFGCPESEAEDDPPPVRRFH